MADERQRLQERRQLLVARASMQRLQVTVHLARLREGSQKTLSAAALLSNPPVRSAIVALAAFALGRTRFARVVRIAGFAYLAVKVVRAVATRDKLRPPAP